MLFIIECPKGTFGENCSEQCPDIMYGEFCAKRCDCKANQVCNRVDGCIGILLFHFNYSNAFVKILTSFRNKWWFLKPLLTLLSSYM